MIRSVGSCSTRRIQGSGGSSPNNDDGSSSENASLLIKGLLPHVSEQHLRNFFDPFGPITSIEVFHPDESDGLLGLGSAYIRYRRFSDAQQAKTVMDMKCMKGNSCRIKWGQHDPTVIIAKNLSAGINNEKLHSLFGTFGNIWNCKLMVDSETGKSRGFGYVRYETYEVAETAVANLDGRVIDGMKVRISIIGKFNGDDEKFEEVFGVIDHDLEEGVQSSSTRGNTASETIHCNNFQQHSNALAELEKSENYSVPGGKPIKLETDESDNGPSLPFSMSDFEATKKYREDPENPNIETIQDSERPPIPPSLMKFDSDSSLEKKTSDKISGTDLLHSTANRLFSIGSSDSSVSGDRITDVNKDVSTAASGEAINGTSQNYCSISVITPGGGDERSSSSFRAENDDWSFPNVMHDASVAIIPEAFLVDECDNEIVAAQAEPLVQLPWWKDFRAKVLFAAVIILLAGAAVAVGVLYPREPANPPFVESDENSPVCVLSVKYDGPLFEEPCDECNPLVDMYSRTAVTSGDIGQLLFFSLVDRKFKLQSVFESDHNISSVAISENAVAFVSQSFLNQSSSVYICERQSDGTCSEFALVIHIENEDGAPSILITSGRNAVSEMNTFAAMPEKAISTSEPNEHYSLEKQKRWYPVVLHDSVVKACTYGDSYDDRMLLDANQPPFLFDTEKQCCAAYKCATSDLYTAVSSTTSQGTRAVLENESANFFSIRSLDLSGDVVVVGVGNDDNGFVLIFRHVESHWSHEAYLSTPSFGMNNFGSSVTVSISGNMVAVGDPFSSGRFKGGAVFVYVATDPLTKSWELLQEIGNSECDESFFGTSITFNGDDELLISCQSEGAFIGALHSYQRLAPYSNFTLKQKITAYDGSLFHVFGGLNKVAVDGEFMAVGSTDKVYMYHQIKNTWDLVAKIEAQGGSSNFGNGIAMSGEKVIISSGSGAHSYSFGYFNCLSIKERIETEVLRRGAIFEDLNENDPRQLALDWILHKDTMKLNANSVNLSQRYILALIAYSMDSFYWKTCKNRIAYYNEETQSYSAICEPIDVADALDETSLWLLGSDECQWVGISCEDGVVVDITLGESNLVGEIPPEISGLISVQSLRLSSNCLYGTIPQEVGDLHNLKTIDLSFNGLSGTVPNELFDLYSLQNLYLNENSVGWMGCDRSDIEAINNDNKGFVGEIFHSNIGKLKNLDFLYVSGNSFSGSIGPEISNLKNLVSLDASNNMLTGTIPEEFAHLNDLREIFLGHNALTGNFPSQIGNMSSLRFIDIQNNPMGGVLPDSLYNLTNLIYLYIGKSSLEYKDGFQGSIKTEIGNLKNLSQLYLEGNPLTGTLPTEIANCIDLSYINVGETKMGGMIPDSLYNLTNLQSFIIEKSGLGLGIPYEGGFQGSIKTEIGNLKSLRELKVRGNPLTGTLPTELGRCKELESVVISNTNIHGTVPYEVCDIIVNNEWGEIVADCRSEDSFVEPSVSCECCNKCCDHITLNCELVKE